MDSSNQLISECSSIVTNFDKTKFNTENQASDGVLGLEANKSSAVGTSSIVI